MLNINCARRKVIVRFGKTIRAIYSGEEHRRILSVPLYFCKGLGKFIIHRYFREGGNGC